MSEPVRVLHIVHALNRGGMESRIMDLYRHLDKDRYQYDFYIESGQAGMFDEEVISLGGRIYYSKRHDKYNIPNFKAFRMFLTDHPECKIVYAYNQWSGWYLKEAKKCGIPNRIANARTSIETKSVKNTIKNIVKLNVNKYATYRFAVSKKAATWLYGERALQDGLVKIWPNAIDVEKYKFSEDVRREVREELGLGDSFTVIHVGNFRFEKNHPFLLRVFSEIKKKKKDAKLVLAGAGDIESLKSLMNELGIINDVIYLGVRKDVPRILQAGDVFVFPSLYEGFPGAVLEAEASGLRCIISDSITDEVLVTDHIKALSLNLEPQKWAEEVDRLSIDDRHCAWIKIREAGFDIKDLTRKTEAFLLGLI